MTNLTFGSSKKPYLAAIGILAILAAGLLIAVIFLALPKPEKPSVKDTKNYCYKSNCLKAASELLDSINTTVPPCNDFYQHVCGKWITDNKIPPHQDHIGTFVAASHIVIQRLTDLLQESPADDEVSAVTKAKIFFKSCMDMKSIEAKSVDIIKGAIQTMRTAKSHIELVAYMIDYNANVLVPSYVSMDSKNVTRNRIIITQNRLMLGSPMYYNKTNKVFTAFENLINGFSEVLMNNNTKEIIKLEWNLKDIYPAPTQNSSAIYNLMTIEELSNRTQDQVKWLEIFRMAINHSESDVKIDEKTVVVVEQPEYVEKLAGILNTTDLETLISYATLNYVMKHINAMPSEYQELYNEVKKAMLTTLVSPSRETVCTKYVRSLMPNAMSRLYVDNYFPASSREKAVKLVLSLRKAMEGMFKATDWMDEQTRAAAIEKVKGVLPFIGYSDAVKDDEKLNEKFIDVNFTRTDFMKNIIKIDRLIGKSMFGGLDGINDRNSWRDITAALVNAFYSPAQNAIFFPAGILQPPFYNAQYPLSMLFGAMGAVVGHEFTHGFDTNGAQYDEIGNLNDWWTPESLKNFFKRAAGLKKQYTDFPICKNVPGCNMKINGNLTIGENIADTGGIKAAYKAYKDYVKVNKVEQKTLPGLSYDSDQLFFVGFAHIWCNKIKPGALMNQLLTDPHSPTIARVVVTLKNNEAFSDAFKCKENSPMNPKTKYGVW